MIYLPSLLVYSKEQLIQKLELIQTSKFKDLQFYKQKSNSKTYLHLDLVLPEFAKDRSVMTGISLETIFQILAAFQNQRLVLSIHLMGLIKDLQTVYNFFEEYSFVTNWEYEIYLPQRFVSSFQVFQKENVAIGIWLDAGEYELETFVESKIKNYLLMTVVAGKSGQKLTSQTKSKALEIVSQNPHKKFILDGGWEVNQDYPYKNLEIVSYSSFWKEF